MDERDFMHTLIVDSIKLSVREFLRWVLLNRPSERLYAVLIDVPPDGDAVNIIAATEEGLQRNIAASGRHGVEADAFRDELRWSVPGESEPWFARDFEWQSGTTHVILLAIQRGLVPRYETTVLNLAVRALAELERDGEFGTGEARASLYVGVVDIHDDFENCVAWSAECNPPSVTARVKAEVARGVAIFNARRAARG